MPRVAFIILCHQQPELLQLLARSISHDDCLTAVHVDKRVDIESFKQALAGNHSVTFVPEDRRKAIHWCGFSMVEATFNLIGHALAVLPHIERFVLLSGSDYPIYPIDEVLDRLSGDDEFIRVDHKLNPDGNEWFDHCATRIFLGDNSWLNPRECAPAIDRMARRTERRLKRMSAYKSPIFYGPSWWSLTRSAIDYILDIYRRYPEKINWFKYARSPDEMVFHTLMRASPYSDRIKYDATRPAGVTWPSTLAGVHYVDFQKGQPSPKVIGLQDLPALKASGALFGRKLDSAYSQTLIKALGSVRIS